MEYKLVICGGTFDRLHAGHKAFLDFVFSKSDEAIICITSYAYVAKYKVSAQILPFAQRKTQVEAYLQEKNLLDKAHVFAIDDIIGPGTDSTLPIEAIIATSDTKKGAEVLNSERQRKGLLSLPVVLMSLLGTISSTAIRQGVMDTTGDFFIDDHWTSRVHKLPQDLRVYLQKPLGDLMQSILSADPHTTITVGDVTTKNFLAKHIHPQLAVIDLIVERQPLFQSVKELGFSGEEILYPVANPAGTLTPALWETIRLSLADTTMQSVIQIDGEEDLAVIPLVLSAPLGWTIYYGQPSVGLVAVSVTLEKKRETYEFLKRFL